MPLRGGNIIPDSVYVSLNARAEAGTYHWGLLIMDSEKEGTFHHATNPSGGWKYEARTVRPEHSLTLVTVVRVSGLNGTVEAATNVIKGVPADGRPSERTGDKSNSVVWPKDVLVALDAACIIDLPMTIDEFALVAKYTAAKYFSGTEQGEGAYVENDPSRRLKLAKAQAE